MNTEAKFKVTHLVNLSGRYFVFVEQLNDCDFNFKSGMYLGNIKVLNFDIPRKVDENGKQVLNVFGFLVENQSDLNRLTVSDIVELTEHKNDK